MRCFSVLVAAILLVVPLAGSAQQSAVSYQAPDGSEVQIVVGARFPERSQRLKDRIAMTPGLPGLHQDSSSTGKVASLVKGDKLIVWQRLAGRQASLVTRATIRQGQPDRTITPSWWPRLQKPWSRRAVDQHSTTTTLMGWTRSGIVATRARIVAAAGRAGLSASHLGQAGSASHDGDLVFFTGSGKEMMVTFSRIGRRTGVVAHLTEVKR